MMFETAELGSKVPKRKFKEEEVKLRIEMLELQMSLRANPRFPVIIDFAGVDGAGKGATVNLLHKWMDARWLVTHAFREPNDQERARPEFWRFWRMLPPKGQIGLTLSGRYSEPLLQRVHGKLDETGFRHRLDRINAFERTLADDGALILKFWMHLSRDAQKKRLKALEKDPLLSFRVTDRDWANCEMYDQFIEAAEAIITRTSTAAAKWHIVEGVDSNYRSLQVGAIIRDAIRKHESLIQARETLASSATAAAAALEDPAAEPTPPARRTILGGLDMTRELPVADYKKQLKEYQAELALLRRKSREQGLATVLVFEGPDAAGKGGAIRRLIGPLDARNYRVLPFAAPTGEEAAHHYLWRFWRKLGRDGRLTIFDRSWYGRVLVERIEGFASEEEWRRAYAEINDFEDQLIEHGVLLVKYWVHISNEEQLARFRAREATPWKRWKITDEDWRNREQWDAYDLAAHEMIENTSTHRSPWVLVEGNNKHYARIKVLKTLCRAAKAALGG